MNFSFSAASTGFLLGASFIVAIGAQNAFVLRQGLLRQHVFPVALLCSLSDAVLIAAGVGGLGTLVEKNPDVLFYVTLFGIAFLAFYGFKALQRARHTESLRAAGGESGPLGATILMTLLLTFANPHVYLDTVVLLGSISARFPIHEHVAFALGAMSASFLWFFGLAYGARLLTPLFQSPLAWRILDLIIALVMFSIALGLALHLRG
ncbi:LysE/ArgO family amino acid transporter [Methylovirgula sp. 4M-Z18]|uniref:LysE/ArgO family amino acid transporter n=1 Tax=Methylovirgula sp. 4M-Z18 TaxID=2293567 RepID=UPI000E2E47E6|nr:LysE/ArgO family amino acid transporter [Methylovirgula sp. 4M-Z18]RFB78746.1 amino acid transporter [Methylovirgula sp. 4M-Z18]